jgi:hypothetical protein
MYYTGGDGSSAIRALPTAINMAPFAGKTIVSISASYFITQAVTSDGAVYSMGKFCAYMLTS